MQIAWRLDEEESIDPNNLIGDIVLSDGRTTLNERDTYIDSWLDACITGMHAVQAGKKVCIDIPEEPDPLIFEPLENGVRIAYRTVVLEVENLTAFRDALHTAVQALLGKLAPIQGSEHNRLLHGIRDFGRTSSSLRMAGAAPPAR